MIYIENRRKSLAKLENKYPNAIIADVTSKASTGLVKLSPFYPHGGIPVPFSEGWTSKSVEGIWQGLKVFEKSDVDVTMFQNDKMKNLKRTVRKFGRPLGHRKGVKGTELLGYLDARIQIYLPSYYWVLQNKVVHIIERFRDVLASKDIVLLDYETNSDLNNLQKPLSHAYLVKAYLEGYFLDGMIQSTRYKDEHHVADNLTPIKKTIAKIKKTRKKKHINSENQIKLF